MSSLHFPCRTTITSPIQRQLDREDERILIAEDRRSRKLDLPWPDQDEHDEEHV